MKKLLYISLLQCFLFSSAGLVFSGESLFGLPMLAVSQPNNAYELCAANLTNDKEISASFAFRPSDPFMPKESIKLDLEPDETKCKTFTPSAAGLLIEIFPISQEFLDGRGNSDFLSRDELPDVLKAPRVFVQLWLLTGGERTAEVRVGCPTPSGVCAGLYRLVGNDQGEP